MFVESNRINYEQADKSTFSAERFHDHILDRDAYFSAQTPRDWPEITGSDAEPVFMVGFPRSGTTLLDTFLRGHKDIAVTEERPMVNKMCRTLGTIKRGGVEKLAEIPQETALKAAEPIWKLLRKTPITRR